MKKTSKIIVIVGVILLITIISICINRNKKEVHKIEKIEASFNKNFSNYEGDILGENVTELLDKVIINASVNNINEDKLPNINFFEEDGSQVSIYSNSEEKNLSEISRLRNNIEVHHYYNVEFEKSDRTGLIKNIIIKY